MKSQLVFAALACAALGAASASADHIDIEKGALKQNPGGYLPVQPTPSTTPPAQRVNQPIITKDVEGLDQKGPPIRQNPGYLHVEPTPSTTPPGMQTNQPILTKDAEGLAQPVPDVGVSVVNANGVVIITTKRTKPGGKLMLGSLPAGHYKLVIDGPSFAAAMDRLIVVDGVVPPETKSSGPSFSVGGGLFGGGSRSSGHEGERGHSRSSNGGGVGLGISVPLGHGNDPQPAGEPLRLPDGTIVIVAELAIGGTNVVSTQTPYCRDTAGQGMRIGFTVPEGAAVAVLVTGSFGYKWASN